MAALQGWWNFGQVAINLLVTLAGIAFTIAVVDWLLTMRSKQEYLDRLLAQMRSGDRALTSWALRELDAGGFLEDGSLIGADLQGTNLEGADLSHISFKDTNMEDASLQGAVLRDADLSDAVLVGADLRGADLSNACVRGTRFWALEDTSEGIVVRSFYYEFYAASEEAKKASNLAIQSPVFDERTILPDGSPWASPSDLDAHTGKGLWISFRHGVVHRRVDVSYKIEGPAGTRSFATKKQSGDYVRETYTSDVGDANSSRDDSGSV
jgi:hypothetical protein